MTEKQIELIELIKKVQDLHYVQTYDRVEKSEEVYLAKLEKINEENRQTLAAIKALLESGVDLAFEPRPYLSVMSLAVVQNNVDLVELLISFGASIYGEKQQTPPLSRAAEFGADRVVRFLIEEKGMDPRQQGYSVLSVARSSRFSRDVLPYLVSIMLKTKSERLPPPKKLSELTEENILKWLPQISIPANSSKKLHEIIDSLFIEGYSVPLSGFYEMIAAQHPELVFACIALIKNAITSEPKDKVVKSISGQHYAHHGNLVVTGDLKIRSLMVTGNLTVKGRASNVQGCQLFVGGDLECETMYTEGPVIIGGNLSAKKIETYYNDYALEVKQTLQADTLIIDHHQVIANHFDVKERIEK